MKKQCVALILTLASTFIAAADVNPDIFTLDNGMKFILLPRAEEPNSVAVGWVAKVGSVNERPGITGISHFFEHLMFKGTNSIGTNNAQEDADFTKRESDLRNQMLEIVWEEQYNRFKRGEIDDPWDAKHDTPELASLRKELKETMEEHREVIVKDEFSSVYQGAGATGMNAFTSEDVTFYINQLPANKFELWCWMESDRLKNSVFREFFSERDVVHEERRMRTESSPTGVFQEQFNSMFWQASPYSWPVIGWPSDLNSYTLEEAIRYYDVYYQPSNLIGVVVGDFKAETIKPLISEYFGSIEPGTVQPPPVPTIEPNQLAPQRMVGEVEAQSQVEVRYHGVPFRHKDSYALQIMASVLNGKTGRLYKSMVEGSEIASGAVFSVDTKKYAGALSFGATVKGSATPEELEGAWYEQVELLQNEPVTQYELEKVKNNVVADQFRGLQSNFYLMIQLGYAEAIGGWEEINESKDLLLSVTAEDIMSVANRYLNRNNSSVAIYYRADGVEEIDDELAAFGPQEQMMIKQALADLETMDETELAEAVQTMRKQSQQVPPEFKPVLDYLMKKLQEKINASSAEPEQSSVDAIEQNQPEEEVVNFVEAKEKQELTPQQLAQATEFLANLEGVTLEEAKQIQLALQMAATKVPADELAVLEYVLAKFTVRVAELESQTGP
jgi:predicted Zn-dependent peptidase